MLAKLRDKNAISFVTMNYSCFILLENSSRDGATLSATVDRSVKHLLFSPLGPLGGTFALSQPVGSDR